MKYQIIYADPPWSYGGRKLNASTNGVELADHYPTMEIDEICRLPISDLADRNCVLFLWVVYPVLEDSFKVIKAWGFRYSTVAFEWVKLISLNTLKPVRFMGANVVGGSIELCLLARRGTVKRIDKTIRRTIWEGRQRHSQKPNEARNKIVRLFGDLPRIELFARQKTPGWDSIGFDIDGCDIRESLDKLVTL